MDEDTEITTTALVPVADTSLAVSLARAEVDQQIATARALPRSISKAVGAILTLATLDAESAAECIYALPRGGKPIKGASIRLAEIIASQWGNNRNGARVVHVDRTEKYVEAEGFFHDLEHNTATTSRVRRSIANKQGRLLAEDMIIVTGNAACSIAKRNAILGGVPKGVWRKAYDAVEKVISGDIQTLAVRRTTAMKAFAAFGVKPEQVAHALGVAGLDDIGLEHMPVLIGMHSALKNGESTVEEMFHGRGGKAFDVIANPLADEPPAKPRGHTQAQALAEEIVDPDTGEVFKSRNPPAAALPSAAVWGQGGDGGPAPAASSPPEQSKAHSVSEHPGAGEVRVQAPGGRQDVRAVAAAGAHQGEAAASTAPPPTQIPDDEIEAASEAAYQIGREDAGKGRRRRDVPTPFSKDTVLMKAWLMGWDSMTAGEGS